MDSLKKENRYLKEAAVFPLVGADGGSVLYKFH